MAGESPWTNGRPLQISRSIGVRDVCPAGFGQLLTSGADNIAMLEPYCSEFLIHAADAEGLQAGIDEKLVSYLAEICSIPVTYAGGGRTIEDLKLVERLSDGKVDLTIGSALDIFGGKGVTFDGCCTWNKEKRPAR